MIKNTNITAITASAITYQGHGEYDVIELSERTARPPQAGEVRIKVVAAAVNPTDILLRTGALGDVPPPVTPGMDAAGIIEAVGAGVNRLAVGDEVMAVVTPVRAEGGAQAGYIVVPAASVVRKPHGITLIEAATLPMNGLTALYALDLASLPAGRTLAVSGGAGWLAYCAISAAKQRGLRIIADASARELELVRSYGADVVVERSSGFADAVRRQVPEGADALLDTAVLGETSFHALREGGVYIPVRGWGSNASGQRVLIKPVLVNNVLQRTDWLESLRELTEDGRLAPRVSGTFSPQQVGDAQRMLAGGGVRGRPVIVF